MQMLLADRLTEAREEALNAHVFRVILDEYQTRLAAESDLVPLVRRNGRISIVDGIAAKAQPLGSGFDCSRPGLGVSSIRTSMHASASRTPVMCFSPPDPSVHSKPPSLGAESAASPRIGVEDIRVAGSAAEAVTEAGLAAQANPVGAVRRRFYGRDCEDALSRVVSMNSGLAM